MAEIGPFQPTLVGPFEPTLTVLFVGRIIILNDFGNDDFNKKYLNMKYISNTEEKEIGMILKPLQDEVLVQQMRAFIQHGSVSTYDHSLNVAKTSYMINRIFQIHSDKEVLLMGAMLHDFYLYDWHDKHNARKMHGFSHAELACENAEKYLDVPKETRNVIYCHMWPLNLTRIPPSKEAWIVCVADKVVSLHESLFMR